MVDCLYVMEKREGFAIAAKEDMLPVVHQLAGFGISERGGAPAQLPGTRSGAGTTTRPCSTDGSGTVYRAVVTSVTPGSS